MAENGVKKHFLMALKDVAPVLFATVSALAGYNPVWEVLFLTSMGLIQAWGEFGQNRVNELVTFIAEHKEEFLDEVLKTDKFKAIFLNVLEMHMKEVNDEKRKLLRNYLLSAGKNIAPDFNEHTKIISTLNTITLEEIKMLRLFAKGGPIEEFVSKNPAHRLPFYAVQSINSVLRMSGHEKLMFPLNTRDMSDKYNQMLLSLGYKDLLWVASSDGFGSGEETKVRGITDFGQTFLDFIRS